MDMNQKTKSPAKSGCLRRIVLYAVLLLLLALALNNIPGRYTFDTVRETYDRDSPEGIALEGLESGRFRAVLFFEEAAVQQTSRSTRFGIPAGSTVQLDAHVVTSVDDQKDEVVLLFREVRIESDKPITYLYRNLPLGFSRVLESVPGDPKYRIRARGWYRVLGALFHLRDYGRARGPRRVWQMPARADLVASAELKPEHTFAFKDAIEFSTSARAGAIRIEDAVFENDEWHDGRLTAYLHLGDVLRSGKVVLSDMRDGEVSLHADLAHRRGTGPELTVHGGFSWSEAALNYDDQTATAQLVQVRARPQATLILTEELRMLREAVAVDLEGRVEDLVIDNQRDRITVPLLDLHRPLFSVRLDDEHPVMHLIMRESLDVRDLNWTRTRSRETLRVENAGIRLEPFTFRLCPEEGGSGSDLRGALWAGSVRITRRDDQWIGVDRDPQLELAAETVRVHDGEILVRHASVHGRAGLLETQQRDFSARLQEAEVSARMNREEPDVFTYEGEARADGGGDIRIEDRAEVPDLTITVAAKPMGFRGDQDHTRVSLPELTLSVSHEELMNLLDEALERNRDRIWEETRRRGRLVLDLQQIESVRVRENQAEVTIRGRVRVMGPRVFGERVRMTRSFSVGFVAEFELPAEGLLHEADIGVRVESLKHFSLRALPDPINRYLPDLIEFFHDGPLLYEKRPLKELVRDVPGHIHVRHIRIYGKNGDPTLEVSGEMEIR